MPVLGPALQNAMVAAKCVLPARPHAVGDARGALCRWRWRALLVANQRGLHLIPALELPVGLSVDESIVVDSKFDQLTG